MFREIILPIFRSTRLCVTVCGIMHPRCCRPPADNIVGRCIIPQTVTHSLVLLKIGKIISRNMLSWLELLISRSVIVASSWLSILFISVMNVKQISDNEIYLLIKYIKSVLWRVVKRLSYIHDARCLKVKAYFDEVLPYRRTEEEQFVRKGRGKHAHSGQRGRHIQSRFSRRKSLR